MFGHVLAMFWACFGHVSEIIGRSRVRRLSLRRSVKAEGGLPHITARHPCIRARLEKLFVMAALHHGGRRPDISVSLAANKFRRRTRELPKIPGTYPKYCQNMPKTSPKHLGLGQAYPVLSRPFRIGKEYLVFALSNNHREN